MKKFFLKFIPLFFFVALITAHSQNFKQLKAPVSILSDKSDSRFDESNAIAVDSSGNTIISGTFEGSIKFGSFELNGNGGLDFFIAKRSPSGVWLWAKGVGGSGDDVCYGIGTDSLKNIYFTGYFTSTANFGGTMLTATGSKDIFFAKLDSAGNWKWIKQAGGNNDDIGKALCVMPGGTFYATGGFQDTATFGSINFTVGGIFVSKLDKNGNFVWTSQSMSDFDCSGNSIGVSPDGYIYVGGSFLTQIKLYGAPINSFGSYDACFAKVDQTGTWKWLKHFGGIGDDRGYTMAIGKDSLFYLGGKFSDNAAFGSKSATSNGNTDIYIAKLDTAGSVLKLQTAGSTGNESLNGLSFNKNMNLLACGTFEGTVGLGATNLTSHGQSDIFVAKVDTSLTYLWALSSGGTIADNAVGIVSYDTTNYCAGTIENTTIFGVDTLVSLGRTDIFLASSGTSGVWAGSVKASGKFTRNAAYGLARDNSGNRYVSGSFGGVLAFGTDTLHSVGSSDIFVAKIGFNGNWIWARSVGSINSEIATSLASDTAGNLYVAGYFMDSLTFGSTVIRSNGSTDLYVAKMDSAGNWIWAKSAGGTGTDIAYGISVNQNGKIGLTGLFSSTAQFGSAALVSNGNNDIFAAQLDTNGTWNWAMGAGGTSQDIGNSVAIDKGGNVFFGGYFNGTATFGSQNITGGGQTDIFISKINSAGNWVWTRSAGGNSSDYCNSVSIDGKGHIFATGGFNGDILFGADNLNSNSTKDIFISKLDTAGNWIWSRSAGGSSDDEGTVVYTRIGNYVYVGGSFSSNATFGNKILNSQGPSDIFVTMLDKNGNFIWSNSGGGNDSYSAKAIAAGTNGNINVAGYFQGTFSCDTLTLSTKSPLDRNPFIAQIGPWAAPSSWNPITQTSKSSTIIVPENASINVNGHSISPGDAIGCFYDSLGSKVSAGYGIWLGDSLRFTVWGNNPNTLAKDGFDSLEAYSFKIWDNLINTDGIAVVSYNSGPSMFFNDSISILGSLRSPAADTLKIPLSLGWKWISSYVAPDNTNLDSLLKNVKSHIVIVKNTAGHTYIPQFNLNSIGLWNVIEGYQIFTSTADTLKIVGEPVHPENMPIPMKFGWQMIAYLRSSPQNASTSFSGLLPNLVIAKNYKGQSYIPQFNLNTIGNLQMGEGYQLFLSAPDTLTYPSNALQKLSASDGDVQSFETKYFSPDYSLTGNSMTLYVNAGEFPEGTEIAAFDSKGAVLGAGLVKDGITLINVWGNNSSTSEKDGAVNGEPIMLEAKFPGINSIAPINIKSLNDLLTGNAITDLVYSTDAFYSTSVESELTSEPTASISPNPTTGKFTLTFNEKTNLDMNIRIYDATGRILANMDKGSANPGLNSLEINADNLASGTYILRVSCGTEIIEQNLVIKK